MLRCFSMVLVLTISCWAAEPTNDELFAKFKKWQVQYSKTYSSNEEETRSFVIFVENLQRYAIMTNQTGAIYGPDEFADIPHKTFIEQYTCGQLIGYGNHELIGEHTLDPSYMKTLQDVKDFDWRDHGAVSPVKNQGKYGMCWAFGVAGVLEGMSVVAGNKLENISSQELIDCCRKCDGRSMDVSFDWLIANTNGTVDTMESYPYAGPQQECKISTSTLSKARVGSWKRVHDNDNQDKIMSGLLQYGPGSIGVDADCLSGYKGGVIDNCPGEGIDHAVLIVGVGTDNGVDYFTVKNSWGPKWGEKGYFRVAKGKQQMLISSICLAMAAKL